MALLDDDDYRGNHSIQSSRWWRNFDRCNDKVYKIILSCLKLIIKILVFCVLYSFSLSDLSRSNNVWRALFFLFFHFRVLGSLSYVSSAYTCCNVTSISVAKFCLISVSHFTRAWHIPMSNAELEIYIGLCFLHG